MDVNAYLAKVYPNPPCWMLASDVYASELGLPVSDFKTVNGSVRAIASAFRVALHKNPDGFVQLEAPADFTLVLMGKNESLGIHHCGIYYQGSILHAEPNGTFYQDLASIGDTYSMIEYWGRP